MVWVYTAIGLIRQVQSEEYAQVVADHHPHQIYFFAELGVD